MADKPEFIDTIGDATQQRWRRPVRRLIEPVAEPEEKSRLSRWPPQRWLQWRLENITPWKLKSWRDKI
jgi:hypothetical protein